MFFDKVRRLDRIVNVADVSMKEPRFTGRQVAVDASFSATTYRFLSEEGRERFAKQKEEKAQVVRIAVIFSTFTRWRFFLFLLIGGGVSVLLLESPILAQVETESETSHFYNPVGRRDPFLSPFHVAPEQTVVAEEAKTPLQRFDLGQLKLVGVIWEASRPKALVEDSGGLGYIVEAGTLIGANGGVIRMIEPRRIVIEEYKTDFYGKRQIQQRELQLLVADSTSKGGGTNTKR